MRRVHFFAMALLGACIALAPASSKAQDPGGYRVLGWQQSWIPDAIIGYGKYQGFFGNRMKLQFVNRTAPHLAQMLSGEAVFSTWFRAPMRDENLVLVAALTNSNHYRFIVRTGVNLVSIGDVDNTLANLEVVVSGCEPERSPKWVAPPTMFVLQRFDADNEKLAAKGLPQVAWFCGTKAQYEDEVAAGRRQRDQYVLYLVPVEGGNTVRVSAILNGSADAGVVAAPAEVKMVAEGIVRVVETESNSQMIDLGLATSRSFYNSDAGKSAVRHFCAAYARTIAHLKANPETAKAYFAEPLGLTGPENRAALDAIYAAAVRNAQPSCFVSDEQMRAMERLFLAPIPYDFSVVRAMQR